MHKIITFTKPKGYNHCLECLKKHEALQSSAKHLSAVRSFVITDSEIETLQKLLGKSKFHISDEVKVRLHMADEVPWGVKEIGAERFWKSTKGQGIKVAVIDTGISRKHPDLVGQVKNRVSLVSGQELGGHGTHVAGTIAAVANNSGIVGVAPDVELYDVRAFGSDGTANVSDIVQGINWAIENKMDIINMSFGTSDDNFALRNAILRASNAGIILVASAGNNGGALEYPAAYKGVISVGAVDKEGKMAKFSSRGKGLDTVAPGVQIKSTWLKNSYKELDGTSMAAAHVSGLQALQLAQMRARRKKK